MDNLRTTIRVIFERTNPEEVIQKHWGFTQNSHSAAFDPAWFSDTFETISDGHNKDEIEAIYRILDENWMHAKDKMTDTSDRKNIFYTLLHFTDNMLLEESDTSICEFSHLLRWNELTSVLGEDLFTTSFLAYKDLKSKRHRHYFSWPSTISTNNRQLKEVLEKGITELHFHLRGSSQNFDLNWLSLMNYITNRKKPS